MPSHQEAELFESILRIRRCGLVEATVSPWVALRLQKPISGPVSLFSCGSGSSSQLLLQCPPACHHDPFRDKGLPPETVRQPPVKCFFFIRATLVMVSLHRNGIVTKPLYTFINIFPHFRILIKTLILLLFYFIIGGSSKSA